MDASGLKKYIGVFFWATCVALGIRFFLLEDYRIFSDSMSPNLLSGDLIFVNKASFNIRLPFSSYEIAKLRLPKRGEIVAFTLPDHGSETYIKRVVALEGDEVSLREGVVWINGTALQYQPASEPGAHTRWEQQEGGAPYAVVWEAGRMGNYGPVQVPPGHFFVLGDNRLKSIDSREWGPVPYSCLKGKVSLIWLSIGTQGLRPDRIGSWVRS